MTEALSTQTVLGRVGQICEFEGWMHDNSTGRRYQPHTLKLQGDNFSRPLSKHYDQPPALQGFLGQEVRLAIVHDGHINGSILKIELLPGQSAARRRETIITRQWCLRSAAELLSGRRDQEPDPDLALQIAARFEDWVLRPTEDDGEFSRPGGEA